MVQVKKAQTRNAILASASALFVRQGYSDTSIAEIARNAGTSASNIYVYFPSKLNLVFAIFDPWLRERFVELENELEDIAAPEDKLRHILRTLWHRMPAENNSFENNLLQALCTAKPSDGYDRELLHWAEDVLAQMIRGCLPPERQFVTDRSLLAHVVFMAHDGFVMNHKLKGPSQRIDQIIELMVALLLGRPAGTSTV